MFCKKGILGNFVKFTGKHPCQTLYFNKVAGQMLWHRCFPVNFAKFLRTPFITEHLQWLLLRNFYFIVRLLPNFKSVFTNFGTSLRYHIHQLCTVFIHIMESPRQYSIFSAKDDIKYFVSQNGVDYHYYYY